MNYKTISFKILFFLASFSFGFQVLVPFNANASVRTGQIKKSTKNNPGFAFDKPESRNPVLFAAMAAIEKNLNGLKDSQKTRFDRIVDSALQKFPDVSKDELWRVVSMWNRLPGEVKATIDFPTLVAISFDDVQPQNLSAALTRENQTDPPVLFAVSPKELIPGQTQEVTLVGKNLTADMKIQFGNGIQIARRAPKLISSYQISLWVTVAANAPLSERQITVSNGLGTSPRPVSISINKFSTSPAKIVSGWSFQKWSFETGLLTWNGMPADGSTEFPFIYARTGRMIPSNSSHWHLKWKNDLPKVAKGQWQVSSFPMTQDAKNWKNPPGLVGFGMVKKAPVMGDTDRLDIDLTPVVNRAPGLNPYSADPVDLKKTNEPVVIVQPNKPPLTVIKPRQDIKKPSVIPPGQTRIGGKIIKPVLKPRVSPAALSQLGKRTYYLRLVPLNAQGNIIGLPSQAVEIVYDPAPEKQPDIKFATTETVACQSPQARLKGYEPIRARRTDSQYWFIVVSQPPYPFDQTWKVGDHLFFPPQKDSKDFWDYVGDAIGGVISLIGNVVNLISAAWNEIKGAVVSAFVSFLKGVQIGCPGWCETALKMGLDAGLVALGIPPNIPNFNELQNMGAEYIAETIAAEVLAGSPIPLAKEALKTAAKSALNEMRNQVDKTSSGGSFLMHDYTADPRPAYLVVQAYNAGSTATDAGYVSVSEILKVFKLNKTVSVPELQPGETFDIPIFLDPDLDLPDGIPTSYIQNEGWWNRYATGARFQIASGCGCPGATPPGYDLTNPTQRIILCVPQGGNNEDKSITSTQPWGSP